MIVVDRMARNGNSIARMCRPTERGGASGPMSSGDPQAKRGE